VLVGPIAAKTPKTTDGSGETQIEATDT